MALITTFNAEVDRIKISSDNKSGIGFSNSNVYFTEDKINIRDFSIFNPDLITVVSLSEFARNYDGFEVNSFHQIEYIDSYDNILILYLLDTNEDSISVHFIDLSAIIHLGSLELDCSTIDRVDKNGRYFVAFSDTDAYTFDALQSETFKKFENVRTATREGNDFYFVLDNDRNYFQLINLSNINSGGALESLSPELRQDVGVSINHLIFYKTSSYEKLTVVCSDRIVVYDLISNLVSSTTAFTTVYSNKQSPRIDNVGNVYFNSAVENIFDIDQEVNINHIHLTFMTFADLQSTNNVQNDSLGNVIMQSDNEIRIYTDIEDSVDFVTTTNTTTVDTISSELTRIDFSRFIEYSMPVGSHQFSFFCNHFDLWSTSFDLTFYMSAGYNDIFSELDTSTSIHCILNLEVDGNSEEVTIDLTNSIKNTDIRSTSYSMNDYRLLDNVESTFRNWKNGKSIRFSNSTENIKFIVEVPSSVRERRNDKVRFQFLKYFKTEKSSSVNLQ